MVSVRSSPLPLIVLGLLLISCSRTRTPTAPNGPPPQLVDDFPVWSPDGSAIAYQHWDVASVTPVYPQGLYVYYLPAGPRVLIHAGVALAPAWSPDGARLAYVAGGLHIVEADGARDTLVLSGESFYPSWSPDGRLIAIDTPMHDPRGASAIELFDPATGVEQDISVHGTGEWREPRWSPDGRSILHFRYLSGAGGAPEIFVMDTTGQNPVRLTNDTVDDRDPCWSRDGSKICWTRYVGGDRQIWVMNLDGTGRRFVIRGVKPAFSPLNDEILFSDVRAAAGSQLSLIAPDGTNLRRLSP